MGVYPALLLVLLEAAAVHLVFGSLDTVADLGTLEPVAGMDFARSQEEEDHRKVEHQTEHQSWGNHPMWGTADVVLVSCHRGEQV